MQRSLPLAVLLVLLVVTGPALADGSVSATLRGLEEVPPISTPAAVGRFDGDIADDDSHIDYHLSYSGLIGAVTQAHIHFAQKGVNGGIVIWLCSNLASPPTPPGVQACPTPAGEISGTITAADVVALNAQGIGAGELREVIRAMRRAGGATYVNVHTTTFPGGEIRGQLTFAADD